MGVLRSPLLDLGSLYFAEEPACGLAMRCSSGITVRITAFAAVHESKVGRV
jgi:hypothetical protein